MIDISIVIGFKDWGADRLLGAVRSLIAATQNVNAEIIVSDYGSQAKLESREAIRDLGAKYLYVATNGIWSRSRALNAGLKVASGRILATTDADMVFTEGTFATIVDKLTHDPGQFILMQCRDLPAGIDHEMILSGTVSEDDLMQSAVFRPRWGMGGLIAVPSTAYRDSRGLDERMEIYGGEDIDFARRMKRLGLRQTWLDDDNSRMYHVWHPSSRSTADKTADGRKAIALNRDIQLNDKTISRNTYNWDNRPEGYPPLVSIVISTYNRAEYLTDCILSIQAQSFPDWELILIDDGSTDETQPVVASFDDPRIRYIKQENQGLAAARNRGTILSRGRYIAVHDDDDIMLPDRLQHSLAAMREGVNGTYGGWIDYVEETGKTSFNEGKNASLEALLFSGGVYLHPTLFIEKRMLEAVRYDPQMRSGSDYNLALRLQRAGVKLVHSGHYLIMRRLHDGQITNMDSPIQKSSGAISSFFARSTMLSSDSKIARTDRAVKDKPKIVSQRSVEPRILQLLPDGVVNRDAVIQISSLSGSTIESREILKEATGLEIRDSNNDVISASLRIPNISLNDLQRLTADKALEITVDVTLISHEKRNNIKRKLHFEDMLLEGFEKHVNNLKTDLLTSNGFDSVLEMRSVKPINMQLSNQEHGSSSGKMFKIYKNGRHIENITLQPFTNMQLEKMLHLNEVRQYLKSGGSLKVHSLSEIW